MSEISKGMERKRRSNSVQKADKKLKRVGIKMKERNKIRQGSNFCSRLSKTELA